MGGECDHHYAIPAPALDFYGLQRQQTKNILTLVILSDDTYLLCNAP